MLKSHKTSPKLMFEQLKRRRQTINITQSQYNMPEKIRSPKTQKKQSYFIKQQKTSHKTEKNHHNYFQEAKKSHRINSLTPYENNITPKKLLFYHNDSSDQKNKLIRKSHSISLVDTPKKLNLKKKTEEHLMQSKDKQSFKKNKYIHFEKNKQLKIENYQIKKLHGSCQNIQSNRDTLKKSKNYSKNCQNYDIYYNEGSLSHLKTSKKVIQNNQQKSSRTLKINRNSKSQNSHNNISRKNFQKQSKQSTKYINSPRHIVNSSKSFSKIQKLSQVYLQCSIVMEKYGQQLVKLKNQNKKLKQENENLKHTLNCSKE